MTVIERLQASWRYLGRLAEAMDYDPIEELRRRVERLERHGDVGSAHTVSAIAAPETQVSSKL